MKMKSILLFAIILLLPKYGNGQAVYNYVKTNSISPRTASELLITSPIRFPNGSIQSVAFSKPPVLDVHMVNDSIIYEVTPAENPYTLGIEALITRPIGCGVISSVRINGINYPVPLVSEGSSIKDTFLISFAPVGATPFYLAKNYEVAIASGTDTVKQSITLYMGIKICIGGYIVEEGFSLNSDFSDFSTSIISLEGKAEFNNINTGGYQAAIFLPTNYANAIIAVNGILTNKLFRPALLASPNKVNARGAIFNYTLLYTRYAYLRPLQKIELQ